jgi:hypothetical protein
MQVEASDLKAKEAVQLSFRLPLSGVAVDVVGVVAWGDEKRHGIQLCLASFLGPVRRFNLAHPKLLIP